MPVDTLSGYALSQIANKVVAILKESGLSASLAETVLEKAQGEYLKTISPSLERQL